MKEWPALDGLRRQRAKAHLRGTFWRVGLRTEPERTFETGGLRWRFPTSVNPCEAVIVNTGGGVAGGDAYEVELALREGAGIEATTVAAEKIYRSDGPAARIAAKLSLAPGARLLWLPQETILFEGARLERKLEVEMVRDSSVLCVESVVFGRIAAGETRVGARLHDSWRVFREGRLILADETQLDDAGATLDRAAVGAGARALAVIVAAAPNLEARLPELRAAIAADGVEGGASAFDGLVLARLLSASSRELRAAVIAAILALSGRKPPRPWV